MCGVCAVKCDDVLLVGVLSVVGAEAGHRVVLPGETPKTAGASMARGGTEAADRELGERAWPEILRIVAG